LKICQGAWEWFRKSLKFVFSHLSYVTCPGCIMEIPGHEEVRLSVSEVESFC
jgi:hypothetical protein